MNITRLVFKLIRTNDRVTFLVNFLLDTILVAIMNTMVRAFNVYVYWLDAHLPHSEAPASIASLIPLPIPRFILTALDLVCIASIMIIGIFSIAEFVAQKRRNWGKK